MLYEAPQQADSEQDLARNVVAWLRDTGWDVYQEVEPSIGGGVADIVAKKGNILWVIECKLTLGLSVMRQAHHWKPYVHKASVAVPALQSPGKDRQFAQNLLQWLGLGHISIEYDFHGNPKVYEVGIVAPVDIEKGRDVFGSVLREEHKTWAEAGNAAGKKWTPFQGTLSKIRAYLETHEGADIDTILEELPTHYSSKASAKNALLKLILRRKIKDIRIEAHGKKWQLYLKPAVGIVPIRLAPIGTLKKPKKRSYVRKT